jgi:uncharacterized protein involved in exopolysaccharide biosynthesis
MEAVMYQQPSTRYADADETQEHDPLMQFARRWWWLLLAGAIVGFGLAIVYSRVGPVPYESTALVQVVSPSGATTTEKADQAQTATANFAAEVASPRIYTLTSQKLAGQINLTASDFEAMERDGSLAISPMRGSNFIKIVVSDPDPDRARLIAGTMASVFVDDITSRAAASNEARQTQVNQQIEFTRQQLATAALRQREIDLSKDLRDQQSLLLNLQTNYQEELGRQAESDAVGDRSSFSENELAQQADVRQQLLRAISEQVTDTQTNIESIKSELSTVQADIAKLPADDDGSLSAAFSDAYSLQLTTLTQQYVTGQVTALTQGAPVMLYGDASTPFATMGMKKLGMMGIAGGLAAAAGLGLAFDLLRKLRVERARKHGVAGTATPDFERLVALVDELSVRGDYGGNRNVRKSAQPTGNPTLAGE